MAGRSGAFFWELILYHSFLCAVMPNADNPPPRTMAEPPPALSWPVSLVVALLPVGACFLGGSTSKWAEGMVVAFFGVLLLLQPPRRSLGWPLNLIFLAFVLSAAVAFLPQQFFSTPAWRTASMNDLGIQLPPSVSPQPWLTVGCLVSLLAGVSWLYFAATQELELRGVRFQLRTFATGMVFLASLSLLLFWLHQSLPFWQNARGFGPFPNRNQTADLFGVVSILILAAGQDDVRYHRKRWMLWLVALVIVISALVINFSRAGILFLMLGSALWIAAVAWQQPSSKWLGVGGAFVLLLASALFVFGGETLARFNLPHLVDNDFRWLIFHDTWKLINASPWCGLGLGNFESVFAIFRDASHGNTRALHPESDWLWLWAELGPLGPILVVVGAILLIRHVMPMPTGTNQRFRLATLIGAISFALHGLVDVSGHRVGTAYAALFLFGMSLHRPLSFAPSRLVPWIFRALGLIFLISGGVWILASRDGSLLPGGLGVANVKQQAESSSRGRNYKEAVELTTRGLQWAPLDWQLYYLRGVALAAERAPREQTLNDFRRARFLEPNSYSVPLEEGVIWSGINPQLSFVAWREALRRAGESDRAEVFRRIFFNGAVANPNGRALVEKLAYDYPDLSVAYLQQLPAPDFRRALPRLLESDPDLKALTERQRREVFRLWQERGDQAALANFVQAHPGMQKEAWRFMAQQAANSRDFHHAAEIMRQNIPAPVFPPMLEGASLDQVRARAFRIPIDYAAGYTLARRQETGGLYEDMLVTVRHFTDMRNAPSYFNYLEATGWAAKNNWDRSWKAWLAFESAQATNR